MSGRSESRSETPRSNEHPENKNQESERTEVSPKIALVQFAFYSCSLFSLQIIAKATKVTLTKGTKIDLR